MKAEPDSYKRFLLLGILPFALIVTLLPLAPLLISPAFRTVRSTMSHSADESRLRFPKNSVLEEKARRTALNVVNRWEFECRHKNGVALVSAADLQRLRHAIQ